MKLTLTLCLTILSLLIIIFALVKQNISKSKKITLLTDELEKQQKNIDILYENAKQNQKIEKDKKQIDEKIKEAKTDEENISIINNIISTNNNKLRNNKS